MAGGGRSRGAAPIHINLDAVIDTFSRKLIDEILEETGRTSRRVRKLPAYLMMYYVIALGLMTSVSAREVLRRLTHKLRESIEWPEHWIATRSAITQARERLGPDPVRRLFERLVRPIAKRSTIGAWYRKWRLIALDGSSLNLMDSAPNEARFGKPAAAQGKTAPWAQARVIGLAEIGTGVIFAAALSGWRTSELALAREVIGRLEAGMLCVADRLFYGFAFWKEAVATGAELMWRVQKTIVLPKLKILDDGSYLSEVRPPTTARLAARRESLPVRVIEFTLSYRDKKKFYRVITTLLDPRQAPAAELASLYKRRWRIETTFGEIKTYLKGREVLLRGRTPALVEQDFYGLLLAHFGVRSVMQESAREQQIAPSELSYVHAVRVIMRYLPEMAFFSPLRQLPAFA